MAAFMASLVFFGLFLLLPKLPEAAESVSSDISPSLFGLSQLQKLGFSSPEKKVADRMLEIQRRINEQRDSIFHEFNRDSGNQSQPPSQWWPQLFPQNVSVPFVSILLENVSTLCAAHVQYTVISLLTLSLNSSWAFELVDSWGKLPNTGLLRGHVETAGDFWECLRIRGNFPEGRTKSEKLIRGKYCSTSLLPGKGVLNILPLAANLTKIWKEYNPYITERSPLTTLLNYAAALLPTVLMTSFMGTCFPSSCTNVDVELILKTYHSFTTNFLIDQEVLECYTEDSPPFSKTDKFIMVVLIFIILMCLLGTIFEAWDIQSVSTQIFSVGVKLSLAFSIYTNTRKIFSTRILPGNLSCLHGLKFLNMSWIIMCHTLVMFPLQLTWNLVDVKQIYKNYWLYPLINGTPSVDTFFLISGTLATYNVLHILEERGRLNYFLLLLHRYLRITPTYLIVLAITATLLRYAGSGPKWYLLDYDRQNCAKNWWHNILYVNNLVSYTGDTGMCYVESWYLANDMQFFFLSPLVVYLLWRWTKLGFGLVLVLSLSSIAIPAYIVSSRSLAPTLIPTIDFKTYLQDVYVKPWTRFGPYMVGIQLGYILHCRKNYPGKFSRLSSSVVRIGWIASTSTCVGIIFGGIFYFEPENADTTFHSIHADAYAGLHRYLWATSVAWVIFACVTGHGGFINQFLSAKPFIPLGRLTYCMYLTSFHMQMIYHLKETHPTDYSVYKMVYFFIAHLVAAVIVSYFFALAFELPVIQLERLAQSGIARKFTT